MKRTLSLASLGAGAALALLAPATAFAATATDTVKVQWTVSAIGTIKAYANFGGTVGTPTAGSSAGTVNSAIGATADGSSRCASGAAPGSGTPDPPGYLVDFGNVTPDYTHASACLYRNAVAVQVQTNSINWGLSEQLSASPTTGFSLCAIPTIGSSWPETPSTGASTSLPASTNTAANSLVASSVSACPTGTALSTSAFAMVGTGTSGSTLTGTSAVAEDLGLVIGAMAPEPSTNPSPVQLNFTLTYN
ncbi:MAG: hypothetical protein JOZ24_02195 [Candidatus Eremiobacteraeota bacterium]|nr:hypothetical protein [Candidatus Eremiobacteraeota bacterium]